MLNCMGKFQNFQKNHILNIDSFGTYMYLNSNDIDFQTLMSFLMIEDL